MLSSDMLFKSFVSKIKMVSVLSSHFLLIYFSQLPKDGGMWVELSLGEDHLISSHNVSLLILSITGDVNRLFFEILINTVS